MKRTSLGIGIVFGCLLAAPRAHADVGVVVTGEATLLPQLASQLEGWLTARGHSVLVASLDPDAVNTLIDCFTIGDLGCARTVVEHRAKTQTILFAKIDVKPDPDGSQDIDISGYWLAKGHDTLQEKRSCQHCTDKTMAAAADDLLSALTAEPPSKTITPEAPAGPAAPPPPVSAPTSDVMAPLPPPHRSRALPIAVTAVGAAALVTGVVFIAVGGPPSDPHQLMYWDLRTPGYAIGAAGLAVTGVGLYLLLRPHAHSAPVAAITHDGAVFGWTGRF
jgi:hypothetical protein